MYSGSGLNRVAAVIYLPAMLKIQMTTLRTHTLVWQALELAKNACAHFDGVEEGTDAHVLYMSALVSFDLGYCGAVL